MPISVPWVAISQGALAEPPSARSAELRRRFGRRVVPRSVLTSPRSCARRYQRQPALGRRAGRTPRRGRERLHQRSPPCASPLGCHLHRRRAERRAVRRLYRPYQERRHRATRAAISSAESRGRRRRRRPCWFRGRWRQGAARGRSGPAATGSGAARGGSTATPADGEPVATGALPVVPLEPARPRGALSLCGSTWLRRSLLKSPEANALRIRPTMPRQTMMPAASFSGKADWRCIALGGAILSSAIFAPSSVVDPSPTGLRAPDPHTRGSFASRLPLGARALLPARQIGAVSPSGRDLVIGDIRAKLGGRSRRPVCERRIPPAAACQWTPLGAPGSSSGKADWRCIALRRDLVIGDIRAKLGGRSSPTGLRAPDPHTRGSFASGLPGLRALLPARQIGAVSPSEARSCHRRYSRQARWSIPRRPVCERWIPTRGSFASDSLGLRALLPARQIGAVSPSGAILSSAIFAPSSVVDPSPTGLRAPDPHTPAALPGLPLGAPGSSSGKADWRCIALGRDLVIGDIRAKLGGRSLADRFTSAGSHTRQLASGLPLGARALLPAGRSALYRPKPGGRFSPTGLRAPDRDSFANRLPAGLRVRVRACGAQGG